MNVIPSALLALAVALAAAIRLPAQEAATPAATPVRPPAASAPAAAPAAAPAPEVVVNARPASPAPPASAPAATRNIRFQFDGIPYADVIERFAQMAGKPLLADTNVVGTLTYDDPNRYTYTEALDTLNLMLAMKGVMLVEDGNNLRLVPFKQLPAMPLRILRGTDAAGDARPGEVVTVVLDTQSLDAKEVADSVLPMLSTAGSVAPLGRGRGLVVTDRLANIQRVRTLLATIGTGPAADRQMKTYTLLNASGAIVSDLLNRTFGIATAPKRTTYNPNSKAMEVLPPDPNDYVTSVYDEASRTLVLFGPNERLALAEELINRFEQKDGSAGDVRIYQPQTIKAEELANMIRQAIPGVAAPNEPATSAATKARVIADNAQNRLIVAAPLPGQLDQIDQFVNRLDKGILGGGGGNPGENPLVPTRSQSIQLTRIFRPRAAEATNVAAIVRQALTRRNNTGQPVTTASVSYEAGSQSVVVTGSPADLQTAADIVSQLETGTTQPTRLETRFLETGSPEEARRLQPLVEQLYRNQAADGGAGSVAHAKILADAQSGRLIVTASPDHLARIEDLVKQLRADPGGVKPRRLQVLSLKNSRTEAALASIQSLVNERLADRRFATQPKPSIVPDAPNNRLLVTATDDQLREIEEVVRVVDVAPAQAARELSVIPLEAKPAAEIIPLVTQLVSQLGEPGQPSPTLMADPTGKQLIVLAAARDQERIRTLVKQFDVTPATSAPRQFRGIELYGRSAAEFAPLVAQLYQEQLRGQPEPPGGPATLLPETKGNRIMVSGGEREIARVEAVIRQLDPAEKKSAREETRVIRLQTASAPDLAGLVEKSLNAQSQQVRVLLDARSNSLVITGERAAVEAAGQMIQQLDTRPEAGPRELRLLELKSADATALAPMVNNLFTEVLRDQRGASYVSTTRIVPDTIANRLIVTGSREEIEQVASLVNRLDRSPEQAPGARVFKLNQAEAALIAPIVSNAMLRFDPRGQAIRRVTVSADDKSNSLIVSGTRTDLQDAESVIERLDGGSVNAERVLRIFDVKSDPDALAALVQRVFAAQNPGRNTAGLFTLTPEPASRRLLVHAPPAILAQIETAVTTLDARPDQGLRELHAVELAQVTAPEILPRVSQIYAEQAQGKTLKPATILADAGGTRLLVQGTAEQAAAVRQIVETLASAPRPARESRVFDLGRLAEAQRLLPLVQQLYRDQVGGTPSLGTPDAQIVSDGRTGRLLVSARADQLPAIEAIVNRLKADAGNPATRETRTLEVGTAADVQRLQPLVQQLYQDQWKDRQDTDPADAQIVPDPRTGRLIVTGKPAHLDQIEALLKQLGAGQARTGNRQTRIIDLSTASAVELAGTVRTLYTEQAKGRLGSQAPDTLITPDAGGNRLILVGDPEELAAVEEIVRQLDKVSAQSASARVFKIKSADPDKVAEILTTSLVRYDAYGRAQKRATVSVDAKTRTLIVTGDPKELQGVSVIIEQLDQSLGAQPERKTQVVTLKQGKAAALAGRVRQLYADRLKSQPELGTSDVLILEEPEGNQLILAGNEAQLALVNQLVTELQAAQVARSARETRMFEVGNAEELTRLQPLVQQLYQDRLKGRDTGDPADAQIIADSRHARFIVTGRTNHLAEIEAILAQLRGANPAAEPRDTRVFDLTSANAVELSATVRTLYQEQARNRPGVAAADTLIVPDANGNRLIVTAGTNELAVVEEIVRKLDKVGAQSASTRVFKVKSAEPDKVAEILGTALVRYDAYGRPQKRVSVVTDPKTRTIIATGDPKELQSAAVIIEQLDTSLGADAGRQMRVIPVKERRAADLTAKMRQIYQDQARNNADLGTTEPLILEDAGSNQLIVAGTERQLAALEEISVVLQRGPETGARQSRVFPLERTTATALVSMISQLYARQVAATEPAEKLVVSSGGNERTLIVDGPAATVARVEELVKSLDQPGPDGAAVVQTIKLTKGRAEDLAEAVNRVMTNRASPGQLRRVSVTAVAGANSLLLNGPTNAVQEVIKIVRELDAEGEGSGEIEVRIYKLENGSAREVSSVLQQLLQSVSRNLRRPPADGEGRRGGLASVSVDERSNSLIISATPAHFRVVDKILPTLDRAPDRSDRDVQFVWLRKAKAYEVASRIEMLFEDRPRSERPVIEPDLTGNSLTLIARRGDLAQIQDLIARLDEQGRDSAVQVRLRPLERVAADQMARMLQNIYPQMSGTPLRVTDRITPPPPGKPAADTNAPPAAPEVVIAVDKAANALVLLGPAQELDGVERLVSDLSYNFYGNESEFRLFAIREADPVVVARTLTELLRQDAVPVQPQPGQPPQPVQPRQRITVVAEPRTRSVIVRARPTDFALMESLIQQLDHAGQTAQLEFRLVPLTNAPPEKILPLVQQMVTQLATSRPGEPVTVAVDARGRGMLVVARDNMASQVEKLIHSLDRPSPNVEAEVQIIPLKRTAAAQLAAVLQGMIRPGAQGEATAENRELQEQVRRLKVRNEAGEPVVLDLTRPIKIATDPAAGAGGGNRLVLTSTPDNLRALAALVELMDSVPVLDGVKVRFFALERADAATVSQTLTSIFTQGRALGVGPAGPGGEPADQGRGLVAPLGVAIDARSNTLIVSGRQETLELAQKIIADLDRDLFRFVTEVRLFRLKHASALRLMPLLQSVFAEGSAVPGTEGLSTQITRLRTLREGQAPKENETPKSRTALTIQADELSNTLIVAARSDNLPLIADVIDQLDIPAASGLETVRIYPLQHADPAAVQKVINDLYAGQRPGNIRNEDRPVVTVDARTGSLIVAGNTKAFGVIEGLLQRLDQQLPFDLRDIALVTLEHADASVVGPTLQKLMDARVTQRATLNQGQADALKVVIIPDQRSNSLLVGGSREGFELVQNLARQLDQAGPALGGRVRLIALQHADARVLAATLATLFEQRYAALRNAEAQRNKPVLLADARSNALLVAASQEDNRTLDDLLQKLDVKQDNPALVLTVLPLKHNDSGRVAAAIEGIFAARLRAQTLPGQTPLPSEQIKLEPDPLNNALIVSASRENLELIRTLLQDLDKEPDIPDGVFEMFTLKYADAQRVSTILKSLVEQGLYRPGRLPGAGARAAAAARDVLSVSVDPRSNTLLVSASPENLALVREVVKRLDSEDLAATADVRVFPLKNARASTVATTLTQFFQAKRTADSVAVNANQRTIPATVLGDDRVNSILVTGGKEAFELVERLLPQLDGESVFSRLNFRVFPLKKATALKLQATLQPIFANRPPKVRGEPVDPITIIADQWINALLVGATVEDLSTVASLVEKLDSDPSETGIAIHVFPLLKADARRVATTVQGLFRENLPNQVVPITVTADERINALVVSCGETDAQRIGELVRKLDTDQVARVSEIRVFPLRYARAETLSSILNTALNTKPAALNEQSPNAQSVLQFITRTEDGRQLVTAALKEAVLITPDPRVNSLIVSGPVDYMGLLEQIIERLDASAPQVAKIKVFELRNADARQMADVLTQMFRMTPAGGAAANQRSVQYTLVRPAAPGDPASLEEALASATLGTAEQNALTVTVDPRTNSLLVGGTDHYVVLVSQLIDTLDSSTTHERNSEVIRLKNSTAPEVATAIRNFLDQERQKIVQALGVDAAQAAQRMFDQEVAVVAETTSNTLLLSANRRYFKEVRDLIDQLDLAQPQVLIQVLLAEVTLDNTTDLGVEWSYTGRKGDYTYGLGTDFNVSDQLKNFGGFSGAVTGTDFNFLIRALKDQGRLEVLSRPQIVTADNKPATINIGQRVPLVDQSRLDAQNNLTTQYRYEDVGVNLTVTPKISPDGFVKMEIGTTNSALSSSTVQVAAGSSVPIINQRKANTTVSAQSGQTIIIGGLIATTDDKRVRKLPVLGEIPYLGALFRTTTTKKDRKELLILLTPQVMENRQTPVPLQNPDAVLRRELDASSSLRPLTRKGDLQRQMIQPLFDTNHPSFRPAPPAPARNP